MSNHMQCVMPNRGLTSALYTQGGGPNNLGRVRCRVSWVQGELGFGRVGFGASWVTSALYTKRGGLNKVLCLSTRYVCMNAYIHIHIRIHIHIHIRLHFIRRQIRFYACLSGMGRQDAARLVTVDPMTRLDQSKKKLSLWMSSRSDGGFIF